jgi:hypothetical protein
MSPTAFAMMCHQQSGGAFCFTQDREIKREILSQQMGQKTGSRSRLPYVFQEKECTELQS